MFASKTLTEHLARGVVGVGALVTCVAETSAHPLLALAMVPIGLVALRGCPMCWTVGLLETLAAKLQRHSPPERPCLRAGTCARPSSGGYAKTGGS
jgi:hypothetical protein